MKVLITGCAGFGGSGLTNALLQRGYEVTGLDIVALSHTCFLQSGFLGKMNYLWKSIHDIQPADLEGHEVIIHLAAQADVPMGFDSPVWTCWENVHGTLNLLEAMRQVEIDRVIYAGSGNEWGRPLYLPIDEKHPLTPHNPYAWSKAAAEMAFWTYLRCYDVPIVIMSNGIVIGPNMRREIVFFKWLYNILAGRPIVLEGGDQSRDVTYISDVIDAWILAIEAPRDTVKGEKFQISYGEEHTLRELACLCMEVCGIEVPVIQAPHRLGEKGQRECFDITKARQILGYSPKVGPRDAIARTAQWVREQVLGLSTSSSKELYGSTNISV